MIYKYSPSPDADESIKAFIPEDFHFGEVRSYMEVARRLIAAERYMIAVAILRSSAIQLKRSDRCSLNWRYAFDPTVAADEHIEYLGLLSRALRPLGREREAVAVEELAASLSGNLHGYQDFSPN